MTTCLKCGALIVGSVVAPGDYASFVQQREAWIKVLRACEELGFKGPKNGQTAQDGVVEFIERIARDARAEEQERCAGIAENSGMATGDEIAKRIRAGEPEKGAGEK